MPVPKYRTSSSKRDMRRSHHALKAPGLSTCPNCDEIKLPHVVCSACGFYRGKQVMKPKTPKVPAGPNEVGELSPETQA